VAESDACDVTLRDSTRQSELITAPPVPSTVMPPKSSQKPAPKGNGNIMAFFGGGGGSSQAQAGPSQSHAKSQSTAVRSFTLTTGIRMCVCLR
jgi:hypothetical protein